MPGILVLTMIVIVVVIVVLFVRDSRRAQATQSGSDSIPAPAPSPAAADPGGRRRPPLDDRDMQALAGHVRELRRAVDEGLIGREEAIASIVRHADGRLGEQVAEQLLDSSELD